MMKNQLAGLMKQAQQMQDNMKKVQDSLADIEVEGQRPSTMRCAVPSRPPRKRCRPSPPACRCLRASRCRFDG